MPGYDPSNVFARILRGEIPCKKVLETPHALAFHDINPAAPVHVLVIPKGAYASYADFATQASEAEIIDFTRAVAAVVAEMGLGDTGYRLIANAGADSNMEVPHLHVHVLGGTNLGPLLARSHG